jgi:hypothetical protein
MNASKFGAVFVKFLVTPSVICDTKLATENPSVEFIVVGISPIALMAVGCGEIVVITSTRAGTLIGDSGFVTATSIRSRVSIGCGSTTAVSSIAPSI